MSSNLTLGDIIGIVQELSRPEVVESVQQTAELMSPYATLLTDVLREAHLRAAMTKVEIALRLEKEYSIPWQDALLLTLDTQVALQKLMSTRIPGGGQ